MHLLQQKQRGDFHKVTAKQLQPLEDRLQFLHRLSSEAILLQSPISATTNTPTSQRRPKTNNKAQKPALSDPPQSLSKKRKFNNYQAPKKGKQPQQQARKPQRGSVVPPEELLAKEIDAVRDNIAQRFRIRKDFLLSSK